MVSMITRLVFAAWLLREVVALAAPKWGYKHDFVHLASEIEPQLERRQQDTSFRQLREDYRQTVMQQLEDLGDERCNSDNVVVREEWGDMSTAARQDFIDAIQCLRRAPAHAPPEGTGVRTRWDEFVYVHAIDTIPDANVIHGSPFLLPFHRALNTEMEFALRDECDYDAGLPYMDWTKYIGTPMTEWPMFDGSPISLGSNGEPTDDGCRCVTQGPLSDWEVNLGSAGANGICSQNSDPQGLAYNPHCLERSFDEANLADLAEPIVLDTILDNEDVTSFMTIIESAPHFLHGSMHAAIGGLQDDVAFAPGDVIFFLMHAWLDLVWCIWQNLDVETRGVALSDWRAYRPGEQPVRVELGTRLPFTEGFPEANGMTVRETMSTVGGRYCYMYQ